MMRPIFIGIPYLALAFTISRLSDIWSSVRGTYSPALENLHCQILLKIHWYLAFGLDEFVADVMMQDPARYESSLINILHSRNQEFSSLAFSTLRLYFDSENTCQVLEQFIDTLDSKEEKAEYRRRLR